MRRGSVYVFAQLGLLTILALSPQRQPDIVSYLLASCAVLLGVWAIVSLPRESLTVMPEVKAQARFTKAGPYRYVRHPMYTALMLLGLAMWWVEPNFWRLGLVVVLGAVLIFKSGYEEQLLRARYKPYAEYQKYTARFIPYIF